MRAAGYECPLPHPNCCQAELNVSYSWSFFGVLSMMLQSEILRCRATRRRTKRRICSAFIIVIYQSRPIRENVLQGRSFACCERATTAELIDAGTGGGDGVEATRSRNGCSSRGALCSARAKRLHAGRSQSYCSPNALSAGTFAMMPASLPASPGGISS